MAPALQNFVFLALPPEIRQVIYSFTLPGGGRIYLDEQNFYRPLPYRTKKPTNGALELLRTCRSIHTEAVEYIMGHNIVNVIKPLRKPAPFVPGTDGDFLLYGLGAISCSFLTTFEAHVSSLGSLGNVWETMETRCPKLQHLRLVFYHDTYKWSQTLAQLVHCIQKLRADQETRLQQGTELKKDTDEKEDRLKLKVELYTSIWAHHRLMSHETDFQQDLDAAIANEKVLPFRGLPRSLRTVTVTASVDNDVSTRLLAFPENDNSDWCFRFRSHVAGPPVCDILEWVNSADRVEEEAAAPQVVEEEDDESEEDEDEDGFYDDEDSLFDDDDDDSDPDA